jgi:pterin-4a-carbinolamine dehydratase
MLFTVEYMLRIKDIWHLEWQMSHLSVQIKFDKFLQTCIITFRNRVQLLSECTVFYSL